MFAEQFLNRKSRIGNKLVLSSFQTRRNLTKIREWFNKEDIQKRKDMVKELSVGLPFEIEQHNGFKALKGELYFPEVAGIVEQSLKIVHENNIDDIRRNKKEQLAVGLLKKETLTLDSPFVQFALRKDVIGAISKYLGIVPILHSVDVWYSKSTVSKEFKSSQLHHLDWDAETQIKIFIYAMEVPEDSGPLAVMEAASSEELRTKMHYRYEVRVTDAMAEKYIPVEKTHVMTGTKGDVIFADTSRCFHYGSRVKDDSHYRILSMIQYLPPQAFRMPLDYHKNSPYAFLSNKSLPEYQQMVLGAR